MLTKSTPIVMTTTALITVCSLVSGLGGGGWRRDGWGGWSQEAPQVLLPISAHAGLQMSLGLVSLISVEPLAPAQKPQAWWPVSLAVWTCHCLTDLWGPWGTSAGRALFSLPLHGWE